MPGLGILVLLLTLSQFVAGCKELDDIYPCFCSKDNYDDQKYQIRCSYIWDVEKLRKAFLALNGQRLSSLILKNCDLPFLPGNMFNGIQIDAIYLLNSNLTSVQGPPPEPSPFTGVIYVLESLNVADSRGIEAWRWPEIAVLKRLKRIQIENSPLPEIPRLEEIPNLQSLVFRHTSTARIDELAFAELTSLVSIEVSHNSIKTLSRSMFSNPVSKLRRIYFRDNKLESLPNDIFDGMRDLEWLDFSSNKLQTIGAPASSSLQVLNLEENPLVCDCRLTWILKNKPSTLAGACSSPSSVQEQPLMELSISEVCNTE